MVRGRGPKLPEPGLGHRTVEDMTDRMREAREDAEEWRRLAELADIEWIYQHCLIKARECDAKARSWSERIARAS